MRWYHYIICLILIIVGVFSTFNLVDIFSVKSGEYGKVFVCETPGYNSEFSRFDYGNVDLDTEDYYHYKNVSTFATQQFDGIKNVYTLYFNDQPLNNVVQTAGRISGELAIKFYDTDGEIVTTAQVNVVVEYLASATKVTMTINNDNNAVSYLNAYTEINGAILRVVLLGGEL